MLEPATRGPAVPRRIPALTDSVKTFDPAFDDLLPDDVHTANLVHRDALAVVLARRSAVGPAREAVLQARADDDFAAREAVTDAKALPPASTTPSAVETLDRVERALIAAEEFARSTQHELLPAVQANLAELRGAVRERQLANREHAKNAVGVIADAVREVDRLRTLSRELDEDALGGRNPFFEPVARTRRRDPAAEIVATLRALLEPDPPTRNQFV